MPRGGQRGGNAFIRNVKRGVEKARAFALAEASALAKDPAALLSLAVNGYKLLKNFKKNPKLVSSTVVKSGVKRGASGASEVFYGKRPARAVVRNTAKNVLSDVFSAMEGQKGKGKRVQIGKGKKTLKRKSSSAGQKGGSSKKRKTKGVYCVDVFSS